MRIRPDWEQPPAAGLGTAAVDEAACPHCRPRRPVLPAPADGDSTQVVRADWNGLLLARSTRTLRLDGVVYFPAADVRRHYLRESGAVTLCPVDGQADRLDVVAYGSTLADAAWCWRWPSPARPFAGYVGFAQAVSVTAQRTAC